MRRMFSENQVKNIAKEEATSLITSGELENAKPVYIHPIVIVDSSSTTRNVNIAIFIFNNDETPFTTWEQVRDYIVNVVNNINDIARFLTTGAFISGSETYVACHIYCQKVGEDTYSLRVEGSKSDGSGATGYVSLYSATLNVYDGVNKIN